MKAKEVIIRYDYGGLYRLIRDIIYTKITYKKARIIRLPFYIKCKKTLN
jgi:hypothetical protein